MANPFMTLSNKFACDLEEILQCPVCYDTLSRNIPTCIQGHHLCLKCQEKLSKCPFCQGDFLGTRNYLAENLLIKYDEIKSSLISPIPRCNLTMVSAETQTDCNMENNGTDQFPSKMNIDENDNIEKNNLDFNTAPVVGKGLYPCPIKNCQDELPHGRMMNHFRYYHQENLIQEKLSNCGTFKLEWMYNESTNNFQRIISVPKMGIFYVSIALQNNGDLYGNVQIINKAVVAKQFNYTLSLNNVHTCMSYKGQVLSCRTTAEKVKSRSFLISNLYLAQLMGESKSVKFSLILQRSTDNDLKLI